MRRFLVVCIITAFANSGRGQTASAPGGRQSSTAARVEAVDQGVRAFMQTVAGGVTHDGPSAWRRYFLSSPAFFMAVNGSMVFANPAAAEKGIADAAAEIKHIDLTWGAGLRVDPLTPTLAVVAAPWHEVRVTTSGRIEGSGFFTAVVELRDGHWLFRDVHWSEPVPPARDARPR
jgi:hypothetical protein